MNLVFENGPSDLGQHVVMLALADNAEDQGTAFPGVSLIARKSRMSERNALRVLASLEIDGWLTIRRRSHRVNTDRGMVRMGNTYCLNLARLRAENCTGDKVSPREMQATESNSPSNGRHDNVSPEQYPVQNPVDKRMEIALAAIDEVTSTSRRGDIHDIDEVTKGARRSDKCDIPIKKNHQEPSGEPSEQELNPKNSPLPPPRGVQNNRGMQRVQNAALNGEVMLPGMAEMRAAFDGVLKEVRCGLLADTRPPALRGVRLADGAMEWDTHFGTLSLEDYDVPEGAVDQIRLVLTSQHPALAQAGFVKYRRRFEKAMQTYFGKIPQVTWRSREEAA